MNKVLIVDDNQSDRELLKEILSCSGVRYDIREAASGRMALVQIEENPPDVVLLDIQMSDINGFAALKEFSKRKNCFIPVLLVSAFTGENDRLKGIELGASDFINKPLIAEEVIARVAAYIKLKKMYDKAEWVAAETNEGIKILYKELEKDAEKLKKLDILKSNFVSTVSHELRTPLAIIRQGVSLLHRKILGEVNERQTKILSDVLENIDRLIRTINEILDISKLEARKVKLDKKAIDPMELLPKIADQFQLIANSKHIALTVDLPQSLPMIFGDKDNLIQVLTNLVGNAIKFTSPNGKVIISAKEVEGFVQISVSDTGRGISKEDIQKLFDKFQQFGRKDGPGDQGTGLGLAISKEIVELHQGEIWAESEINKGSHFHFTIPKYETLEFACIAAINNQLEKIYKNKVDQKFSLILVCIENYEQMKSSEGEVVCQKAMTLLINSLREELSKDKIVMSCSFDKVAIMLPAIDKVDAFKVGIKIREVIESRRLSLGDKHVLVKLQIGVSGFPQDGMNGRELLRAAEAVLRSKKKILVVDDHPQVVAFLTFRLEAEKRFYCTSASDGEEALQRIHENIPDLIICDIAMPKMSGYDLVTRLQEVEITRGIPVVFLTALNIESEISSMKIPVGMPVIAKTEGFEKILETIDQLL